MSSMEDTSAEPLEGYHNLKSFLGETRYYWLDCTSDCDRDYNKLFQILKNHPHLAKERFVGHCDVWGSLEAVPLVYLLTAHAPLAMIKEVYQMNPDAVRIPSEHNLFPIHFAINHECSGDIFAFVLDEFPEAAKELTTQGHPLLGLLSSRLGFNPGRFNAEDFYKSFQVLYDAFPPNEWDDAGIHRFKWNDILTRLLDSRQIPPDLLGWIAKKQPSTKPCKVKFWRFEAYRNLGHFVPALECQTLCLSGYDYNINDPPSRLTECRELGEFFSTVNIPPTLTVHIEHFDIDLCSRWATPYYDWSSCQIAHLALTNCSMAQDTFDRFFQSIPDFPNLQSLSFHPSRCPKLSCTTGVIELLEAAPALRKLSLVGPQVEVDIAELSMALQEPSLSCTAFVEYRPSSSSNPPNVEIAYLSALNYHGHTKLAAPNASLELLVNCLGSVRSHAVEVHVPMLEESLLYGLLREAPGLWASAAAVVVANKKRPAACEPTVEDIAHAKKKKRATEECVAM